MQSRKAHDNNNPKVTNIKYTRLEYPVNVIELLSKECIILFLEGIINVSDTHDSIIPNIEKLRIEINGVVNDHMKYFDPIPQFKMIIPSRRATFTLGKRDLMITSQASPKDSDKNQYLEIANEVIRDKKSLVNVSGIPLVFDLSIKKEIDSLFMIKA